MAKQDLLTFLTQLASNPKLLEQYKADPAGTAAQARLSPEETALLQSGDAARIEAYTGEQPATIVKTPIVKRPIVKAPIVKGAKPAKARIVKAAKAPIVKAAKKPIVKAAKKPIVKTAKARIVKATKARIVKATATKARIVKSPIVKATA